MEVRTPVALALALALSPASALAQRWSARVVARAPGSDVFAAAPVQARVGQEVELTVVLVGPRGQVLGDVASVRLGRRVVRPAGPLPARAAVRWERVEPRPWHVERPSPNAGLRTYSNNILFGPRHGRWLGYDRLEYESHPLATGDGVAVSGATVRVRGVHPGAVELPDHGGAGSAWYAAEVTLPDGARARTPDATTVDRLGLSRDVARVSFRAGDDFLGWLGTYFYVPNVFGSNGGTDDTHQTDRYVGADCADVLVGALRAMGRRARYVSVAQIGSYARAVTPVLAIASDGRVLDLDGNARELRWGQDVRAGDLVAIDYTDDPNGDLPRAWDHIGALVEDLGGAGVLDGGDTLRHIAGEGLVDQPLRAQGAIRFVVWRWRRAATRKALWIREVSP